MEGIFQWWESHCGTNTSAGREKEIQKSRNVRATVRDQVGKLTI